MLSVFMLARRARAITCAALSLTVSIAAAACEKVPLLAPTGSTITLVSGATALPLNGSTTIIAQVLESAGTPPHSGTTITFTTTLGTIQPSTATTDASGTAKVNFLAGTSNGTASINAISGGATTSSAGTIKIALGTASVGRVAVNANPTNLSSFGGTATIFASVYDINGNALPSVPVVFTTSAGSLSTGTVTTDSNGLATTSLTTVTNATVTASVGATGGGSTTTPTTPTTGTGTTPTTGTTAPTAGQASGSVTVTVTPSPSLIITPPPTPPSAGLSASFTFAITVPSGGAVVRNVSVNWGDGSAQQNLGSLSGSQIVGHVYNSAGTYNVTANVTDALGNVTTTATSVTVIPVVNPTVIVTPSIPSSCTGTGSCTVTFQIQVTPPTGVGILNASIDFGDGTTQGLGGLSGSATVQHPYTVHGVQETVVVTVTDTLNRTTSGFTTINLQ